MSGSNTDEGGRTGSNASRAGRPIPLHLAPADASPAAGIEIDGALVARGLGLEVDTFRQLMHDRKVSVLCERGTGADAGLYRASFYFNERRYRAVVDAGGRVVRVEP